MALVVILRKRRLTPNFYDSFSQHSWLPYRIGTLLPFIWSVKVSFFVWLYALGFSTAFDITDKVVQPYD
ncbi:hypothetical protein B4902_21205 [Yersinia frederiksenii]|nr:hypothetical protein B4902_21205 [Yersinia frederiksenii]